MIKNIHVLRKISILYFYSMLADIEIKVPHAKVHIRPEWVQQLAHENPGHNVLITYHNNSWRNCLHKFFLSDNKIGNITSWGIAKLCTFIVIPQALSYCAIAYCIYKSYTVVSYIRSFFKSLNNHNPLESTIYNQLYAKRNRYDKKSEIYALCKRYKKLSDTLTRYKIRKLFWYNPEYEADIDKYIKWYEN